LVRSCRNSKHASECCSRFSESLTIKSLLDYTLHLSQSLGGTPVRGRARPLSSRSPTECATYGLPGPRVLADHFRFARGLAWTIVATIGRSQKHRRKAAARLDFVKNTYNQARQHYQYFSDVRPRYNSFVPTYRKRPLRRKRQASADADCFQAMGILALGLAGVAWLAERAPSSPPQPRYVGIPTEVGDFVAASQKQDMWCWAASIQMLLNFYGVAITQEQIVSRVYGQPQNQPATDQAISASLNGWGINARGKRFVVRSRVAGGPPTPAVLFRQLSQHHPILLTINPGTSIGHAVLVTSVSVVGWNVVSLVYRDPSPTSANIECRGRVELFTDDLARFLSCVRSHWLVSVREL
jgi:hypothetical protein